MVLTLNLTAQPMPVHIQVHHNLCGSENIKNLIDWSIGVAIVIAFHSSNFQDSLFKGEYLDRI